MIEAQGLTRYYGDLAAVKDVSFELRKGDILGFLGPNGAGKSTTMKMLTTFLYPTSGTARVAGHDIREDPLAVRRAVGYLPENAPLYDDMTVWRFLCFAARARRLHPVDEAVERVVDKCFIEEVKHRPIHTLSKGYRQRVCFAQALIHDPDILILDEPTDGLDPNQKTEVRRMISTMGEGKAILLSTHILEEARATCNRAIIIHGGEIKVDDTPENLIRQAPGHGRVEVEGVRDGVDMAEIEASLEQIQGVSEIVSSAADRQFELSVTPEPGQDVSAQVLQLLRDAGLHLTSVVVKEGQLEDIFRQYTTAQEEEAGVA